MAKDKKTTKKQSKSVVKKQNQFRVEYKDRISPVQDYTLTTQTGSIINGPADSLLLVPSAFTAIFNQGTANGQVDGNNINARFLNMKVKMNFDDLPPVVADTATGSYIHQQYNLHVRQGLVLEDISEYLVDEYTNPASGRSVPAFADSSSSSTLYTEIAKKYLFNANVSPDFLSYEKRQDNRVRILKSRRILGDTTSRLTAEGPATDLASNAELISPDKHMSFDWKMPKDKQMLSPTLRNGAEDGYHLSKMWIPFVLITLERRQEDPDVDDHPLNVSEISHFTYTDN